jgi:tetratricopeptide (TPR) repeat protein
MSPFDKAYRPAFNAWQADEYAHALELCREMVRDFPDYPVGWLVHGIVLYELARYDEAEQVIHAAIEGLSGETLYHGYQNLGHLYRQSGNYGEAEKWYRKAVELDPDNVGTQVFLGALLAQKGDLAGAEAVYREATRRANGAVDEAWLNLGLVLRAQERYEEALACFEKALELTPDYPEAKTGKVDMEKVIAYLQASGQ